MICLTSDIHHSSLKTGNQKYCDITEVETAILMFRLLKEANVKATFFVSGKTFKEEWQQLQKICFDSEIEIGGHNYSCFEPSILHRLCHKLLGSYNGPEWYQKLDVQKTVDIIYDKTGKQITSWRNHMYMHGPHTEQVLKHCGINMCSDGVKRESTEPILHPTGIYNFPINIIPDHEHLYHAERTPEWVEWWLKRYQWSDDFGSASYYIEEWTELVLEQLIQNEAQGVVSNLIIHPITMYLCDQFKSFKKILAFISTCQTVQMKEVYEKTLSRHTQETIAKDSLHHIS